MGRGKGKGVGVGMEEAGRGGDEIKGWDGKGRNDGEGMGGRWWGWRVYYAYTSSNVDVLT